MFEIILIPGMLFFIVFIFIKISTRIRKHGGSMAAMMYGPTSEFYTKDKLEAIEIILDQKAGKKMEEISSDIPEEKL